MHRLHYFDLNPRPQADRPLWPVLRAFLAYSALALFTWAASFLLLSL